MSDVRRPELTRLIMRYAYLDSDHKLKNLHKNNQIHLTVPEVKVVSSTMSFCSSLKLGSQRLYFSLFQYILFVTLTFPIKVLSLYTLKHFLRN